MELAKTRHWPCFGAKFLMGQKQDSQVSAEENKEIVKQFYTASNSGDMDTCLNLIADSIKWTNIGSTSFSGTFHGKAELQEKLLGPLFAQLKHGIRSKVHRLVAENDYVVAQTYGEAETHDGRAYNNTYCWVIRLEGGRFMEVTEYMDTELITSILG